MRYVFKFLILVALCSCSTDGENNSSFTLATDLTDKDIVIDNVIACAAKNQNDDIISVFFYPRPTASNFRYYETENAEVDKNDFENYSPVDFPLADVFNGFLMKFEAVSTIEKWVIVAFDEDDSTHLSNPIRLKQNTKPTEYVSDNVEVDGSTNMPNFTWQDGSFPDTNIYFHVVSDATNNLFSGTYTFEKQFQYYKLDNVVLNVTPETPPTLEPNIAYNFTLLGVSEDNWVNLFSEISFEIQ